MSKVPGIFLALLMGSTQLLHLEAQQLPFFPRLTTQKVWTSCKKLAVIGIMAGIGYWIMRSIINHKERRDDVRNLPSSHNVVVVTDGKVTVRQSKDDQIHLIHRYGSSRRSDLATIQFQERQSNDTLTILGHSTKTHLSTIQRFFYWLFRLRPKKTLHHIIEVPQSTNLSIATTYADHYSHHGSHTAIMIDSILAPRCFLQADKGKVQVSYPAETAKLQEFHQLPVSQAPAHKLTLSTHPIEWVNKTDHTPINPAEILEIRACDDIEVRNFQGTIRIDNRDQYVPQANAHHLQISRHPQNHGGKIFLNGTEQPFHRQYSSTPVAEMHRTEQAAT